MTDRAPMLIPGAVQPRRRTRDLPQNPDVEVWAPLHCAECTGVITEYDPRIPCRVRGKCRDCGSFTILDTFSRGRRSTDDPAAVRTAV